MLSCSIVYKQPDIYVDDFFEYLWLVHGMSLNLLDLEERDVTLPQQYNFAPSELKK